MIIPIYASWVHRWRVIWGQGRERLVKHPTGAKLHWATLTRWIFPLQTLVVLQILQHGPYLICVKPVQSVFAAPIHVPLCKFCSVMHSMGRKSSYVCASLFLMQKQHEVKKGQKEEARISAEKKRRRKARCQGSIFYLDTFYWSNPLMSLLTAESRCTPAAGQHVHTYMEYPGHVSVRA